MSTRDPSSRRDGYLPIDRYGIVGDTRTAALVGCDGSVDWLCWPRFDAPSVFGRILDAGRGGHFQIAPVADGLAARGSQLYWPDTNVLVTRFLSSDGVAEVTDFMPVGDATTMGAEEQCLVRRVEAVRGTIRFRAVCEPAFDYARADHGTEIVDGGAVFQGPGLALGLAADRELRRTDRGVESEFTLEEGEQTVFVLRGAEADRGCGPCLTPMAAESAFTETVAYWRRWLAGCTYRGRWREVVNRSALVLKLLTYGPTGAIIAAPTTSLPETVGGGRNWDYRYAWLRDAAFTVYGFLRIGFTDEAARFMDWIDARSHEPCGDSPLQLVYGIDGRHDLDEQALDHLEGYRGSRPVRIGNGAAGQLQLDTYGELLDAVYLYNKHGAPISYELWVHLREALDWLVDNWQRPDEGIWEVRGGRRHFTYSKLMSWVAFDRGLRLADKRSFPAPRDRWLETRDRIYEEVMERAWDEGLGAFVQAYGTDTLDAASLIMPLVFFLSPNDPRMLSTLDAINRPVARGGLLAGGLVYRYAPGDGDGLDGLEGTFNMCSFWLVEALTRAGRLEEARLTFERMLSYSSPLGLYAEETGPGGEALGNYPQAFTHLALISAAFNLDRALDGHRRGAG